MALDSVMNEKLKKAHAEVQARMTRGGGETTALKYWKPQKGVNKVRILPPWTDEGFYAGSFWREVWQHWNAGPEKAGPVLCPAKTPGATDTDCPICALVEQLKSQKSNPEAQELAKDFKAKVAYNMSIIDLKDPLYTSKDLTEWKNTRPETEAPFAVGDPKVQVYAATSTVYEGIATLVLSNELDITDLEAGHNIQITKSGDGLNTKYTVTPEMKPTKVPLPVDFTIPNLANVGRSFQTVAEMLKVLSEGKAASYIKGVLPANTPGGNAGAMPTGTGNAGNPGWSLGGTAIKEDDDDADLAAEMRAQLG